MNGLTPICCGIKVNTKKMSDRNNEPNHNKVNGSSKSILLTKDKKIICTEQPSHETENINNETNNLSKNNLNNDLIESLITSTSSPTDYLTASENSASSVESVISNKNLNTNACISVECNPSDINCMINTNDKSKTHNISACENDLSLPKLQSLTSVSLPFSAEKVSEIKFYSEQSIVENINSQSSLTSTTSTCSSNEEFALPPTSPPSSTSVKPQLVELITNSSSGMSLFVSVGEKSSAELAKKTEKSDELATKEPKIIIHNDKTSVSKSKEEDNESVSVSS